MKACANIMVLLFVGVMALAVCGTSAAGADAVKVEVEFGTLFEPDPVAIQGKTGAEIWVEIYVLDEKEEKQVAQDVTHRKFTVTWGSSDDGILENLPISEEGFSLTKQTANQWVREKDGTNTQIKLVIGPVGKFVTPAKAKLVKIDAEVTFSDGTIIRKSGESSADAFNILVTQSPWSVVNTAHEEAASTADLCPFDLPPFSSDQDDVPEGVTLSASSTNGNITVGPCIASSWLNSYACRVHAGDPNLYNNQGNQNALAGGTLTVNATDSDGNQRSCNITVQVTDAPCKLIWDNVPNNISVVGNTSFGVKGGDAESAIAVAFDSYDDWFAAFLNWQVALVAGGVWNDIPNIKPTTTPGNTADNLDGSVTQNYTINTTWTWMNIVVPIVRAGGGVTAYHLHFTITPNDAGSQVQFNRAIDLGS